ncbi:phage terminase large subunit [Deinococcus rufus]|uniref:Phage terminase large subunit n=1 Tax=Deinococcus rufus TaxID=2136097 RepID=A0ABV7Z8Z8_9DEIO
MTRASTRSKRRLNGVAPLPTLAEVRAEKARRRARKHLKDFVAEGWHVLEPSTPYLHNWHIDVICAHLEAITRGVGTSEGLKRLLINIPPGHMKSLIVNVFWPAWTWLHHPGWRAIFTSYDAALVVRDSVKCRDLITSEWYQAFQPGWKLKPDQNEKSYYFNTRGGFRISLTVGGANTGHRGDVVVVDDPISAIDSKNEGKRAAVIEWWDKAMSSRLNDLSQGAFLVIMQRLHEQDLSGHILARDGTDHAAGGYDHICLPSEFDGKQRPPTSIGWVDLRRDLGELLFPALFPKAVLDRAKKLLLNDYAGQHQQTPVPADGNVFKPRWWRYWVPRDRPDLLAQPVLVKVEDETFACPVEMLPWTLDELRLQPHDFVVSAQSWDMTFGSKSKKASKVVGQVWGTVGARHYLLDQVRDRYDMPESVGAVQALTARWPHITGKLIEAKAHGPAVMQTLRGKLGGLLPVMPHGGKDLRATAVAPLVAGGDVFLPHPQLFAWVSTLQINLAAFPAADTDEIDTLSQYLQYANHHVQEHQAPQDGAAVVGPGDVLDDAGDFADEYRFD